MLARSSRMLCSTISTHCPLLLERVLSGASAECLAQGTSKLLGLTGPACSAETVRRWSRGFAATAATKPSTPAPATAAAQGGLQIDPSAVQVRARTLSAPAWTCMVVSASDPCVVPAANHTGRMVVCMWQPGRTTASMRLLLCLL